MVKKESHDGKVTVASKRPAKKKPKDKPKRPLSGYNFFFKEEREKILKVVLADDPTEVRGEEGGEDFISDELLAKLQKEGGKVSFEEMGKLIGHRWKTIDEERLKKYSELAAEDTERYKKEMTEYNGRQEAKMRSEALKPKPAFTAREPAQQSAISSGYGAEGSNSAFANAGGMGGAAAGYPYGVDLSAYGMANPNMMAYASQYYAQMGAAQDPSQQAGQYGLGGLDGQGAPAPGAGAGMYGQMMPGGMMGYGADPYGGQQSGGAGAGSYEQMYAQGYGGGAGGQQGYGGGAGGQQGYGGGAGGQQGYGGGAGQWGGQ